MRYSGIVGRTFGTDRRCPQADEEKMFDTHAERL
jgi:hypothetical protein